MPAAEPVRQLGGKDPRVRSRHINIRGGGFQKRCDGALPSRNFLHLVEHQDARPPTELGLAQPMQILAGPHVVPIHAFLVDGKEGNLRFAGSNRLGLQAQKGALSHPPHAGDQLDHGLESKLVQPVCLFLSSMHEVLSPLSYYFGCARSFCRSSWLGAGPLAEFIQTTATLSRKHAEENNHGWR